MIDTKAMRAKYAKRGNFTPAGARDVLALCDEIDAHRRLANAASLHLNGDCALSRRYLRMALYLVNKLDKRESKP